MELFPQAVSSHFVALTTTSTCAVDTDWHSVCDHEALLGAFRALFRSGRQSTGCHQGGTARSGAAASADDATMCGGFHSRGFGCWVHCTNISQRVCLAQAVAASGVSLGNLDLTASCTNATNTAIVEGCVRETCLPREQLSTLEMSWPSGNSADHGTQPAAKNVTETLCQRPVREVSDIPIGTYIGAALATTAFFMRMLSKVTFPCERGARIDNDLWWDDAVITFAWILMIPISVLSGYLAKLGMGRDVWTIHPDNITQLLKVGRSSART